MIRRLEEKDRELVLEYVGEEPSINLFIIGDIENFGFDKDFQELWGKFDENNNLKAVLLRFNINVIPYFKDLDEDVSGFKEIISSHKKVTMMSGEEKIVDKFKDIFINANKKDCYFAELKSSDKLEKSNETVKIATEKDASRIYELSESIDEFSDTVSPTIEGIKNRINNKSGRIYYIENENQEVVSMAQTTAENNKSAMVVSVATRKDYRNKGLVSRCVSRLCTDVLKEGKTVCLFYDNPKAGEIYHRLGFENIGKWTMLINEKY